MHKKNEFVFNINSIADFRTNCAEFYRDGQGGIATTLSGALQQKFIKGIFATLIRNLPHNSIMVKNPLYDFSDKVQEAALRYHSKRALEKSKDMNDFTQHFNPSNHNFKFNNATKEAIKKISDDVLEAVKIEESALNQTTQATTNDLANPKQRTIQAVDSYAQSEEFKALSKDKQEAILSLKNIEPSPMPENIGKVDFLNQDMHEIINKNNFLEHLSNSKDPKRLEFLNLVEPTLKEYNFKLSTINKDGEATSEFIKAFVGKDNQLYYVLITPQANDKLLLTGFPTTKIREIISRIKNANEVKARDLGEISSAHSHTSPQLHNAIIPQEAQNTNLTLRANTLPQNVESEIIDVEILQNYLTHTPRNKLSEDLSDLPTLYPDTFANKASVLQNTLKMLNNPKLLNTPQTPQQEVIKEALAQKSGAKKQIESKRENTAVKENLTTENIESQKDFSDFTNLKTQEVKSYLLKSFKERDILNKPIQSKEGIEAEITRKSLSKMTSDSAIQKSVNNGFTRNEHLQAVANIDNLYKNAILKETQTHKSGDTNTIVHRFNSKLDNANALITTKESLDKNQNKIYSLELELIPALKDSNPPTKIKESSEAVNAHKLVETSGEAKKPESSIAKTDDEIIAQNLSDLSDKELIGLYSKIREMHEKMPLFKKTPEQKEKSEKISDFFRRVLQEEERREAFKSLKDEIFTDSKGKEHILTKEVQEQWLKTFELKSLEEAYIPNQSKEVKEALGGKEIRLQLGSLKKLVSQGREEFIPQIKEVLENPEAVLKDADDGFLFIKHLKDDDYFVNVSYEKGDYLVSVSNGIKETRNIQNKLNAGAEFIYQSPSFSSSRNKLLQASQYSTNKIDSKIIPQNTQEITPLPKSKTLLKKEQLLQKYKMQLDELYTKIAALPPLPPNQSNNRRKVRIRSLSQKSRLLEEKIRDLQNEIILKDPNSTPRQKLYAQHGEAYINAMLNVEIPAMKGKGLDTKHTPFDLKRNRYFMEKYYNLNPVKEFGINYAEFYRDGEGAIKKILAEAKDYESRSLSGELTESELKQGQYKGQVSGAFYRKDLEELSGNGRIDLVWGDSKFGLAHIIQRRKEEFIKQGLSETQAEAKALEFVESLPQIIESGKLRKEQTRAFIQTDNDLGVIALDYKGEPKQWIITAYPKEDALNPAYSHQVKHNTSTSSGIRASGDNVIIPQNSTKLQSNAHIGSGIVTGSVAGIETDEQGNLSIDPQKFLLGLAGGAVGSKAIAKGFKALQNNPEFKQRVTKELADTLSKGWDSAVKQYPILEALEPRYIIGRSQRGRELQAKHILREVEKESQNMLQSTAKTQGQRVETQEVIKILESSAQKGQNMIVIGKENFNDEIIKYLMKNNKKVAVDTLDENMAKELGFKYPNVKRTIGASEINHTLLRHGKNSSLVKKSGQKPVTLDEIVNYLEYTDKADIKTTSKDKQGQEVLISGKQINGYYVIVENIRKKNNELAFKTMYFENGKVENHKDFKKLWDN